MNTEISTDVNMGALQASSAGELITSATGIAGPLAAIIEKKQLFNTIGNKKFVRVEGWTTLSAMVGAFPQEVSNQRQDDGRYIAVVELINHKTGNVISRASAEAGAPGEQTWGDADDYAKRSMAATRATSKACRLALSWIMTLAGYEATPAEEISGKARENVERRSGTTSAPSGDGGGTIGFGKHKGKPWAEVPADYLQWLIEKSEKADIRAQAESELKRRSGKVSEVKSAATGAGTVMATEQELFRIDMELSDHDMTSKEMLEVIGYKSTGDIRACDVEPIIAWIRDPAIAPALPK